ncbi:MAG: hypothetical protein K5860_05425 [Bacteroidales bacterium]|nr:hypothetical protein [Bacteroidales bacterium]
MDNVNNSINEIFSNWNMSSKQKGDKYYTLAKQLDLDEVNRLKCIDLAIEQYEKTTDVEKTEHVHPVEVAKTVRQEGVIAAKKG